MKKNSFKFYLFSSLIVFSFLILLIFWIFQITFLNGYYKYFKKNDMIVTSKEIIRNYNNNKDYNEINMIAYKNNICIEILDDSKLLYSSGASNSCILLDSKIIKKNKTKFIESNEKTVNFTAYNYNYNDELLIYGEKLSDGSIIFISTPLKIMGSILVIIQKEFIYCSIVIIVISLIAAYFLSRKFSNPIIRITKESKKMARGNYDVEFKESSIEEINELAETLNNTSIELSKTENLRRELLANVSHDLKTPLTLIKANAEMVHDLTYANEEKRNKNLDVIIKETDRLNMLVEDILDLSKAQSKTMKLDLKRLNLGELVKSILTRYEVLKEKSGYNIIYNSDKEFIIKADRKRLEQVIYNLINNAINYTGKDKLVTVNLVDKKNKVRFEVIDTGKGINKEDINYIWDKYYKADKSYHRVTVGTGLGLSIVKNILEMHNFKYGVETSKEGTKFYFEAPKE